jgi:alpha-glucosidase
MTNEEARSVPVPLNFLGEGAWIAMIFADGTPMPEPRKTRVVISSRTVRSTDTLNISLAPSGGQAVMFSRAS